MNWLSFRFIVNIFDYTYYRVYDVYKRKWKDNMPGLYALCLVTLLQSFNLLCIPFLYELFGGVNLSEIGITKYHFGIVVLLLIGVNYWRYIKVFTYSEMIGKWKNEGIKTRNRKGWLVLVYVALSFITFFGLAIILGEINRDIPDI